MIPQLAVLRLGLVRPPDRRDDIGPLIGTHLDVANDGTHHDATRHQRDADATHLLHAAMGTSAAAASQGNFYLSLRWTLNPAIGFPRTPFQVWRRARKEDPTTPVAGSSTRAAPATVMLASQVIEVRFHAEPQPGRTLTVEALAGNGSVLPGQRLSFTTPGDGRFRAAGIGALRLRGFGDVSSVAGLPQNEYANLVDWVVIDVVGFPFARDEIGPPHYDPAPQGRVPAALDGVDAALLRLSAGQLLQHDPPPPGGGLPTPAWPFPDPATFLEVLRKVPLADIGDCLLTSVDDDPTRIQALHRPTRTLDGMHQPGISTPSTTADLSLKTTQFIGLAVSDNPVALGLGFGTFDVTRARAWGTKEQLPPGTFIASTDYMVTAAVTTWSATGST